MVGLGRFLSSMDVPVRYGGMQTPRASLLLLQHTAVVSSSALA